MFGRAGSRTRQGRLLAVAALSAVDFIVVMDALVVGVALPSIHRDMGFSQADLQWVVNAYTVALGGFLLLGGRVADIAGRRRILLSGLAVLGLASLVGGLAPSAAVLVAGRGLQGAGAALSAAAVLALVGSTFPNKRERERALGIGLGAPTAYVPLAAVALSGASHRAGLASGLFNSSQHVGNALGLAVLATAASAVTAAGVGVDHPTAMTIGYRWAFVVAAAIMTLGAVLAGALLSPSRIVRGGEGRGRTPARSGKATMSPAHVREERDGQANEVRAGHLLVDGARHSGSGWGQGVLRVGLRLERPRHRGGRRAGLHHASSGRR